MKYFLILSLVFLSFCSCKKKAPVTDINPLIVPVIPIVPGVTVPSSGMPFKDYLGVNLFEWDYTEGNLKDVISEKRINLIKAFGGVRHYLDWEKIEATEGSFTFNPTNSGGWFYDLIYARTKAENIDILTCLKTIPTWLMNTYPVAERDPENVPAPYGLDRSDPASYIQQARAAFQFAARYGSNTSVDQSLMKVNSTPRWNGDPPNTIKVGLNLVKFIECDNERDKWWKGKKAEQTAEEYAANMSAFYDGHKGKLGKNVGVKSADPKMKVVMGGLSVTNPAYVVKMIEWCRKNRGLKADGTVDLCFDIINYHLYANDSFNKTNGIATVGVAPELSNLGSVADSFLKMAKESAYNMEVWVTETGYDVGTKTPQRAIAIGNKTSYITQADWNLRTSLLYARHKINRVMFYMLDDVDINSSIQYSSSGFVNPDYTPRPSLYFIQQAKTLLGNYQYTQTINSDPIVDLYKNGDKEIYVLTIPDQKGRTATYQLDLGTAKQAIIHTLQTDNTTAKATPVNTVNGKVEVAVSETPIFVEKL